MLFASPVKYDKFSIVINSQNIELFEIIVWQQSNVLVLMFCPKKKKLKSAVGQFVNTYTL